MHILLDPMNCLHPDELHSADMDAATVNMEPWYVEVHRLILDWRQRFSFAVAQSSGPQHQMIPVPRSWMNSGCVLPLVLKLSISWQALFNWFYRSI